MRDKRGYRLRDGDQIPTYPVTIRQIMSTPEFALGVADARGGRRYPRDYDQDVWVTNQQWDYERGRQWGAGTPRHVPHLRGGKVSAEALRWYVRLAIL